MNFTRKHLAVVFFASVAVAAVGVQANAKPRKSAQVVADVQAPTTIGQNGMPVNNGLSLQATTVEPARTSKRSRRAAARAAKAAPVATTAFASSDVVSEARRYLGESSLGHDGAYQVVGQQMRPKFFAHHRGRFAAQHVHAQGDFEMA